MNWLRKSLQDDRFRFTIIVLFIGFPMWDILITLTDHHYLQVWRPHYWSSVCGWSVGIIALFIQWVRSR